MNEASRIVSELQRKLAELDHRVWLYRRDMASEFKKYSDNLLQHVTSDVSDDVARTMIQSMKNYHSLYSDNDPLISSYFLGGHNCHEKATTATSNIVNRSVATDPCPVASSQSPDQREMGLQGVFTPNYLPLLDHSSHERKSASSRFPKKGYTDKGSGCTSDFTQVDASTEVTGSLMLSPNPNGSNTKRRFTDGVSLSSGGSDTGSDNGKNRRSSLRKSSNSPKQGAQSPRRVRFDVAGEEVLPTSSPLPTVQMFLDEISSTAYDSDEDADSETSKGFYESTVPKRISSSKALRLLSRRSFEDDGTVWTAVRSPSDESASNFWDNESSKSPVVDYQQNSDDKLENPKSSRTSSLNQITSIQPKSDKYTPTDDDLLCIIPQKQRHSKTSLSTFPLRDNKSQPEDFSGQQKYEFPEPEEDDFNEDLFKFDEISLHTDNSQVSLQNHEDSEEDEEDDFLTIRSSKSSKSNPHPVYSSPNSKSSALLIPQIPAMSPELSESLGLEGFSNMDHPFRMPIVRPEVHARAAGLGKVNTFVGSVDGRTGLDESNANNFRSSIGSPERILVEDLKAGRAPQSLAERMLLEDLVEEDWSCLGIHNHIIDTEKDSNSITTGFKWANKTPRGSATKA